MKIKQVKSYFDHKQIAQYLRHIRFPDTPTDGGFPCTLQSLELLIRLHLIAFPMENTAMHYTADHVMDVTPEGVFERLVNAGNGYGSYCFGQNTLLLGILRGLGFRTYAAPGRVNVAPQTSSEPRLTAQAHMVLLVQSEALLETYMVDVAFGGGGLVRPIPLREGAIVLGSAHPEVHRLTRRRHPDSAIEATPLDPASELDWYLEMRCGTYVPEWRVVYQFACVEAFREDHDAQNFALHRPVDGAPFWHNVMVISHFPVSEDADAALYDCSAPLGRLVMMGNRVDKRIGDTSETIVTLQTDTDRIRALKEYFGLIIPEADAVHIQGRVSQLG